jgi:hypothetical protein
MRRVRISPTTRRTSPAGKPRADSQNSRSTSSKQFQGGRRFVDDLPREVIADEAELSRMAASEASAAPVSGEAPSGSDEE